MKISAINPVYSARVQKTKCAIPEEGNYCPKGFTAINFRGGNPEQVGIYGAEITPYNKIGGVATVAEDMRSLRTSVNDPTMDSAYKKTFEYWKQKNKYFANPLYNSSMNYNPENGILESLEVAKIPTGLPATSKFKPYEGQYFVTNNQNFRKYINPKEFFENEDKIISATGKPNLVLDRNVFILEDVTGEKKMMDFGDTGESEIKLFRTKRFNEATKKLEPINDFHVWVDLTASLPKPYADGSYSSSDRVLAQTWKGSVYAKPAKAYVEFLPRITELTGIDPGTILLNDMQAAPVVNYMAEKTAGGDSFYNGKHAGLVTHNTMDAYIERTSYMNMFVDIADKELRMAVDKDPKYIEALKKGGAAVDQYFKELLPKELIDAQGLTSQFMVGSYYLKQGYLPKMSGVSEKFIEKAATDPEFIPALYDQLNKFYTDKKLIGINNAFENEGLNPYTKPGMLGYNSELTLGKTEGKAGFNIKPFEAFNKDLFNENFIDMKHVNEVKLKNKINLMERFNPDLLKTLKDLKTVKGHEYDLNLAVAGLADKNVNVYGYIDPKFVQAAKKGQNVKIVTSIGRGDKQKGFDITLEAFEKYVMQYGDKDPNTVLIMGGALEKNNPESKKILAILKRMNENPKLQGRFAFNDGFSPNKPFFMAADVSSLPSRFAPFELTDLESMKVACTPMVTNGQGMGQKNFDSAFEGEKERATSYKTKHEYDMDLKTLKETLKDADKAKLEKELQTFQKEIADQYRITHGGKTLTEEEITKKIFADSGKYYEYKDILRPYKDSIIRDEMVEAMHRALVEDYGTKEQEKRLYNQLKQYTEWERNGKLSKTNLSSAELYRKEHFQQKAGEIKKEETLLAKLRQRCHDVGVFDRINEQEAGGSGRTKTEGNWIKRMWQKLGHKGQIAVGIGAGAVTIGGLGYAFLKNKPHNEDEDKKHLSAVA